MVNEIRSELLNFIDSYIGQEYTPRLRDTLLEELTKIMDPVRMLLPSDLDLGISVSGSGRTVKFSFYDKNDNYNVVQVVELIEDIINGNNISNIKLIIEVNDDGAIGI